jgi:hypothetical protein
LALETQDGVVVSHMMMAGEDVSTVRCKEGASRNPFATLFKLGES